MKTTRELLLECRAKNGWTSDYRLAKELEIPTQRIYDYMNKKREPDTYALVRIAECLGLDPLQLIAEHGEANAKREEERGFWRGFLGRAGKRMGAFIVALVCTLTLGLGQGDSPNRAGGFSRRFRYA